MTAKPGDDAMEAARFHKWLRDRNPKRWAAKTSRMTMTKSDIAKVAHLLGYSSEQVMEFRKQLLAEKLLDAMSDFVEQSADDNGEIDWYGLSNHLGSDVTDILETARKEGHA